MSYIIKNSLERLGMDSYGEEDPVCILSISTPLRKAKHIENAIDAMNVFSVDTVISIEEEFSPCYQHSRFGLTSLNISGEGEPRLERNAMYKYNGAILLTRLKIIHQGKLHGQKVGHITMLPEESVKINSNYEYWLAEQLILKNREDHSK